MSLDDPTRNSLISVTGGGLLGAIAAVAVKKPETVREGMWRTVAGAILAFSCTGVVCEISGIEPHNYQRVVGVALAIGFAGWHLLTIAMMALDSLKERASERGFGIISDLINIIRGKPNDRNSDNR